MSSEGQEDTNQQFLAQFRDPTTNQFKTVTAEEFLTCWRHYDRDGSGYLEGDELDGFLKDLVGSIISKADSQIVNGCLSEAALTLLKADLLEAYDEDKDGRIDISEMARMLPLEENFLAIFEPKNKLKSSVEFIRIWRKFDRDNNGFLEGEEIKGLVECLFERTGSSLSSDQLGRYTVVLMNLFDTDGDGKLKISEMSRVLQVAENFLRKPLLNCTCSISTRDFDRVFLRYDTDKSGQLENEELEAFLKDLLEATGVQDFDSTLDEIKQSLLTQWDQDNDGKIGRDELKMILLHAVKLSNEKRTIEQGMENLEIANE